MKKIFFRILAYILDFGLVSIILLGLSYITFINPESSSINLKYNEYYNIVNRYRELYDNVGGYFEDGKITEVEYDEIVKKYPEHFSVFDDIVIDEDTKDSDVEVIKEKLDEKQKEINDDFSYKITKLNVRSTIISVIVYILYFGILQYILKGQTVFKKIFRLRVIDNNKAHKKVPLWKYIVRSILICEIVITITDLILLFALKQSAYLVSNHWILQIKYIYEMLFLLLIIVRDDGRSVHDLLLNTNVVRFDKQNKIIEEKLFDERFDIDEKGTDKNNKIISKKSNRNS